MKPKGPEVEFTWNGCVELPAGTMGNGVAPDTNGDGFYVTNFMSPGDSLGGFTAIFEGKNTGYVLHWSPATGWAKVPGTEMPGPNGIAVSKDGRDLYVANWGGRELRRFDLEKNGQPQVLALDLMPDNLRWSDNDTLLHTGQDLKGIDQLGAILAGSRTSSGLQGV